MFLGEFRHSLDEKGRLILPSRYRKELAGKGVLTPENPRCLALWQPQRFEEKAVRMTSKRDDSGADQDEALAYFSNADAVTIDSQGRMPINEDLREFADLRGEVVLTGQFDHIQIWNPDKFLERKSAGEQILGARRR